MTMMKALPILMVGAVVFLGCSKEPVNTTKTTTQTETKEVGSTVESSTDVKVQTASGESNAQTNTYVGTVTEYTPGKTIEVMTGNKEGHAFRLDGKGQGVVMDPATAVGSKVQLVEEKGEKGFHKITVTIAPAA
jgi:ABC-type glycerol-3-phosphate transport system substrate-binding protein